MDKQYHKKLSNFIFCRNTEEAFPEKQSEAPGYYTLMWVVRGMVDLSVDSEMLAINKNQVVFFTPINRVRLLESPGQVNILQFNRGFYCIRENDHEVSCNGVLFFGSQGIPVIDLDEVSTRYFQRLVDELVEEFDVRDTIQEEMLRIVVKRWLIKSTRLLKEQHNYIGEDEPRLELVRQFRILLEMHYKDCHKVSDYAKLLNKSPKTMSNKFKHLDLPSPREMILDRIFLGAKRYLLYTELSVKEVAFKLGFNDASSFSHFFKNRSQYSPSKFRGKHFKD
jgi:AraC-like DNA-binding protein